MRASPRIGQQPDLRDVVRRAKDNEPEAFQALYVLFAARLRSYVARIVGHEEAGDVVQALFVRLMSRMDRYDSRHGDFEPWLYCVARNVALDHLRAVRRRPEAGLDHNEPAVNGTRSWENVELLRTALQRLPSDQREVLLMRHLAGYSPREIAAHTNRTVAAVDSVHFRARRALKQNLRAMDCIPVTVG